MQNIQMFYMFYRMRRAAKRCLVPICVKKRNVLNNWNKMQNHSAKSPGGLGDISKEAIMFSYA